MSKEDIHDYVVEIREGLGHSAPMRRVVVKAVSRSRALEQGCLWVVDNGLGSKAGLVQMQAFRVEVSS